MNIGSTWVTLDPSSTAQLSAGDAADCSIALAPTVTVASTPLQSGVSSSDYPISDVSFSVAGGQLAAGTYKVCWKLLPTIFDVASEIGTFSVNGPMAVSVVGGFDESSALIGQTFKLHVSGNGLSTEDGIALFESGATCGDSSGSGFIAYSSSSEQYGDVISYSLKKNFLKKFFRYLARCDFWLKLGFRFWIFVG